MSMLGLAPSVNVLGSYFPIWIVFIVAGILLTVAIRRLLIRAGLEEGLGPLVNGLPRDGRAVFLRDVAGLVSAAKMMTPFADGSTRRTLGRSLGIAIVLGAILAASAVVHQVTTLPQTDDAEVFANSIGIAPEVNGRIVAIHVADNQSVRRGDLLFEIDPRPFEYALETARSEQAALEGRIADLQRTIAAQTSAVQSATAVVRSARAKISSADAAVEAATAAMNAARSEVTRAEADSAYAENSVLRLEPLLAKQFVTVDQVDQARTSRVAHGEAVRQARARLALAEAQWSSAAAQQNEAQAGQDAST